MGTHVSPSDKLTIALFLLAQTGAAIKYILRLEKRLDKIEYQLYENGGGSMKDQMNDTRADLTDLKTDFLVLKAKLGE
jgi:chitinase